MSSIMRIKGEKARRHQPSGFNKGQKASSSIDQAWKIARIDAEGVNETPFGTEGLLCTSESFKVFVEMMSQNANTGRIQAAGDLFIAIIDGFLRVEKITEDGKNEYKELGPKMTISIGKGDVYNITSLGWTQFLRVESPDFSQSVRLTEASETTANIPIKTANVIREAQAPPLTDPARRHQINIAKMVAADRQRNRKGQTPHGKPVDIAGMPIKVY